MDDSVKGKQARMMGGKIQSVGPMRPMTMLTTEMFEPQDERRKVFNTKSLQLFLVEKFADSNSAGLLFGGGVRGFTQSNTQFLFDSRFVV